MGKLRLFIIISICMSVFQGCATNQGRQFKEMPFGSSGAVVGHVGVVGNSSWSFRPLQLIEVATRKKYLLSGLFGRGGDLFVQVPRGKYALFIGKIILSDYLGDSQISLDKMSEPFEVYPGEVVYVGETDITLGNETGPDLSSPGTWIEMAVLNRLSSKIKIGFIVRDEGEAKLDFLRTLRPQADFKFVKRLTYFGSSDVQAGPAAPGIKGFLDAGFCETLKVTSLRYYAEGKGVRFSRSRPNFFWYGLPDDVLRKKIAEKKVRVELRSPQGQIVINQALAFTNDLGLVVLDIPTSNLTNGSWTLALTSTDTSDQLVSMGFDID